MLQAPYWQIDGDGLDPAVFFRAIAQHFPTATTLYVEGTSIVPKLDDCYVRNAEAGPFLPDAGTIWPTSKKRRCAFSVKACEEIAGLSDHAAEPEIADHVHVYRGEVELLCWYDAFAHDLWISSSVAQEEVKGFASTLGRSYEMVK